MMGGYQRLLIVRTVQNEFEMFTRERLEEWEANYRYVRYILSINGSALNNRTVNIFDGFHPSAQPKFIADALVSLNFSFGIFFELRY